MARWRGKKRQQEMLATTILGLIVLAILGWLASKIPWNSVFFGVFIIVAIGFSVFALYQLTRVMHFHLNREHKKTQRFQQASRVKSVAQMGFLSPTDFEHYVGTLYEGLGYSVTVTRQSGDQGIDLILKDKNGVTTGVQVKRYQSSRVGVPELQHLVGASSKKYDKMVFVTSSDYLNTAREYAAEQGILLIDGGDLTAMAQKVFGENHEQKTFSFRFLRKMEEIV